MDVSDILTQAEFTNIQVADDGSRVLYQVRRPNLSTDRYDTVSYAMRTSGVASPIRLADSLPNARWRPGTHQISYLDTDRNKIILADVLDGGLKVTASVDIEDRAPVVLFEWSADGALVAALHDIRNDTRAPGAPYRLEASAYIGPIGRGVFQSRRRLTVTSVDGSTICADTQGDEFSPYALTWSPVGRILAVLSGGPDHARGIYVTRGQIRRVAAGSCEVTHSVSHLRWAGFADDRTLYAAEDPPTVSDAGAQKLRNPYNVLQRFDLGNGGTVTVTNVHEEAAALSGDPAPEIGQLTQSADALYAVVSSRTRTSLFRLAGGKLTPAADARWYLSGCSVARRASVAACVAETQTTAPELALVNLHGGVVTRVTLENDPVTNIALGRVEPLVLNDALGRAVTMFAVYPVNYTPGRKYPAIIVLYGFEGSFISQAQYITSYAPQVYAARGYVTLLWNYPALLPAKIGDPKEQAFAFQENQLAAIVAARQWLIDSELADPAKIGIAGHSMGSIWADYAIAQGVEFAAAASHSPGSFFTSDYWTGAAWARKRLNHLFGGPPSSPNTSWDKLSPSRLPPPRIPQIREVPERDFFEELELRHWMDAGAPVEFWVYPGEGHVFNTPKGRLASLQLNLDWFEFWLSGREDSSPSKKEQYDRWRRLIRKP